MSSQQEKKEEKGTISMTNDDEIGLIHDKKWQINRIQRWATKQVVCRLSHLQSWARGSSEFKVLRDLDILKLVLVNRKSQGLTREACR